MAFAAGKAFAILNQMANNGDQKAAKLLKDLPTISQDDYTKRMDDVLGKGSKGSGESKEPAAETKSTKVEANKDFDPNKEGVQSIFGTKEENAKSKDKQVYNTMEDVAKPKSNKEQITNKLTEGIQSPDYEKKVNSYIKQGMTRQDAEDVVEGEMLSGDNKEAPTNAEKAKLKADMANNRVAGVKSELGLAKQMKLDQNAVDADRKENPADWKDQKEQVRQLVNQTFKKDDVGADVMFRVGKLIDENTDVMAAIDEYRKHIETPNGLRNDPYYLQKMRALETLKKKFGAQETSPEAPKTDNYGMSHRPTQEGWVSSNMELIIPDFYKNPQSYISSAGGDITKAGKESVEALMKVKGNPEAELVIYRASPMEELNNGDWVTLSPTYAQMASKEEGTKVFSYKVKATEVEFAGDDINEFGYFGENQTKTPQVANPTNIKDFTPPNQQGGPSFAKEQAKKANIAKSNIWAGLQSNERDEVIGLENDYDDFLEDNPNATFETFLESLTKNTKFNPYETKMTLAKEWLSELKGTRQSRVDSSEVNKAEEFAKKNYYNLTGSEYKAVKEIIDEFKGYNKGRTFLEYVDALEAEYERNNYESAPLQARSAVKKLKEGIK